MTIEDWLLLDTTTENSKRPYAHFDYRTNIAQQRDYLSDPENIAHHGFYPFIHYKQRQVKYSKKSRKTIKERDICYAAHIDRCIYQYYSFLLGELYNRRVMQDGMAQVPVAYRTDLHQNNIHFAKRAIDFIRNSSLCADNRKGRKESNSRVRVLSPEEFKLNRSHIKPNPDEFGIPQGSPISGLLANTYMLEVDKKVYDLVSSLNGLYMRYSDDFIIVIPDTGSAAYRELRDITTLFNIDGLTLEPQKTQYFRFDNMGLKNCGSLFGVLAESHKRFINFLGFTFDGKTVSLRTKTTGKYYQRMYKKVGTITANDGYTSSGSTSVLKICMDYIQAKELAGVLSSKEPVKMFGIPVIS